MKRFITSDGIGLAYTDKGCGRPVILIPGHGASGQTWYLQEEALLAAGCRVIAYNNRCHGYSDKTTEGLTLFRLAVDLREFIESLGLNDVVLCGQSMGASVIYAYIARFTDANLGGCIMIDQTPKMVNDGVWQLGMYGLTSETLGSYFDTPLPSPFHTMPSQSFLAEFTRIQKEEPPYDKAATRPLLLDHAAADWLHVLPSMQVPTLFLAGRNSPYWPCEHAQAAAERSAGGRARIIEDCGHAVNWEQPEQCNAAMLEFISRL